MTASDDRCEAWQARLTNPCATAKDGLDSVIGDSATFRSLVSVYRILRAGIATVGDILPLEKIKGIF